MPSQSVFLRWICWHLPTPDEEGSRYCFEFIDEGRVGVEDDRLWFKGSTILGMESGPAMLNWLMQHGLDQEQLSRAYETVDRLHRAVRVDQVVAYYEERSQDIERVLNIFIRCNSGGTPPFLFQPAPQHCSITVEEPRRQEGSIRTGRRDEQGSARSVI